VWNIGGMVLIEENRSAKSKISSTVMFSTITPTWTGQALNPEVMVKDFTEYSLFYAELQEASHES
jgi:hypothetical protein